VRQVLIAIHMARRPRPSDDDCEADPDYDALFLSHTWHHDKKY